MKSKVMLDPMDWTPNDVVSHLHKDVAELKKNLEFAVTNDCTDTLLLEIQNFYGKVKAWLDLYEVVTKGTKG